ncbi:putative vacuolar transporter chaperone 1 [Chiua virens]|nr:putative vacuolar transporter chaperone 1 [Chiua virens]
MSTQPLLQRTASKRIALPVRVEPKVSFANERTFLSWLHFTVVLGGLAVGLLNFGDQVGRISAAMFSAVGTLLRSSQVDMPDTSSYGRDDLCSVYLPLASRVHPSRRSWSL